MRLRSLLWLIALCAFVLPPAIAPAAAMDAGGHVMMSDCPHHHAAPPPAPCPEQGTAKHAAGLCCPMMAQGVALLPATAVPADFAVFDAPVAPATRDLTGLSPHQEPPPPRA